MNDVEFRVNAIVEESERNLRELREELKRLRDQFEEAGDEGQDAGDKFEDAGKQASEAGTSLANTAAAALATAAAFKGAVAALGDFERTVGIINRFGGNINEASRRVNGLASDLDLMAAQQRAAEAGLQLTAHEFANVAVAAQEYAAATGTDATSATDQLIEALAQGEQGGLKRFGIATEGVTGKVNIQTDALGNLESKYKDTDSSADTLAGTILTLRNRVDNLTVAFAKAFDSVDEFNDASGKLAQTSTELSNIFDGFKGLAIEAGAAWGAFFENFSLGVSGVSRFFDELVNGRGSFSDLLNNREFETFADRIKRATESARDDFAKSIRSAGDLESSIKRAGDTIEDTGERVRGLGQAARETSGEFDSLAKAAERFARAEEDRRKVAQAARAASIERGRVGLAADIEGAGPDQAQAGGSLSQFGEIDGVTNSVETAARQVDTLGAALERLFERGTDNEDFANRIAGGLDLVTSSVGDTVNAVAQGEQTMSEAMENLATNLAASLGTQLVNQGVVDVFTGIGRTLVGYGGDVTGPSLIALGGAEIAAGVALGAASAAAAPPTSAGGNSQPASPVAPANNNTSDPQPQQPIVIQYNAPIPAEQVGRTTDRSLRAARRRGTLRG